MFREQKTTLFSSNNSIGNNSSSNNNHTSTMKKNSPYQLNFWNNNNNNSHANNNNNSKKKMMTIPSSSRQFRLPSSRRGAMAMGTTTPTPPSQRSSSSSSSSWKMGGGSLLFGLVLLYLAVVIAVTQLHHLSTSSSIDGGGQELQLQQPPQPTPLRMQSLSQLHHQSQQHSQAAVAVAAAAAAVQQRVAVVASSRDDAIPPQQQEQQIQAPPLHAARTTARQRRKQQQQQARQQQHQQQQKSVRDPPKVHNNTTTATNNNNNNQEEEKTKKKISTRGHPFRQYDLSLGMENGIRPQHIALLTDQERHDQAIAAAALENYDPPVKQHPTPNNVLTAYLEPIHLNDWEIQPLPIRRRLPHEDETLKSITYTRVNSCRKLTQQWPVDDTPAEYDPFLPWIHDVFPTADGQYIQFIAQNKRRCRTGLRNPNQTDDMLRMQPQVALFQHVSVQRLASSSSSTTTRYRLASHDDADPDGIATRFICRFKPSGIETLSVFNIDYDWTAYRKRYRNTFSKDEGGIKSIHTSQLTFSCPVPHELQNAIRTGESVHNDWATLFVDLIPIRTPPRYGPPVQYLQPRYKEFQTTDPNVVFDPIKAWGTNHVLPAIQDSGRWENIPICLPSLLQYEDTNQTTLEEMEEIPSNLNPQEEEEQQLPGKKKHRLVSCIWASAGYNTRGNRYAINDGQRRLLEWITYHHMVGFDHFYLYDNSGAFYGNSSTDGMTSLQPIADLFPGLVTHIPWPSQICNNRPNNVDSPGERSSQYAAEASCRLRFGPHVKWIGQFDIDEYLIPMGNHTTITSLLDEWEQDDMVKIVSFGSWRAWPRRAYIDPIQPIEDASICWHNEPCFHLTIPSNVTMLQAYNCDRQPPGKKTEVMPAEKQVYQPDYVTHHFIHYSAATKVSELNRTEYEAAKLGPWRYRAFPDVRQRFGNEVTEALMLHAKAVAIQDTAGYQRMCSVDNLKLPRRRQGLCRLGVPWPHGQWPTDPKNPPHAGTYLPEITTTTDDNTTTTTTTTTNATTTTSLTHYAYNCYVNSQIETVLVPRLIQQLQQKQLQQPQ